MPTPARADYSAKSFCNLACTSKLDDASANKRPIIAPILIMRLLLFVPDAAQATY